MTPEPHPSLLDGELTVLGRIASASNLTIACLLNDGSGDAVRCVYKPIRGEEPLWDFPDGTLAGREVAAYLVSEALGWGLIPDTGMRENGPVDLDVDLGPGMVQRWVDQSEEIAVDRLGPVDVVPAGAVPDGYFGVLEAMGPRGEDVVLVHRDTPRLHRLAVLDAVLNNADRKGGHILTDVDGRIWGIDHGICLHESPKLRTVLWGWAGRPLPAEDAADLADLAQQLSASDSELRVRLTPLITDAEIDALGRRAETLAEGAPMPSPPPARAIPWPAF